MKTRAQLIEDVDRITSGLKNGRIVIYIGSDGKPLIVNGIGMSDVPIVYTDSITITDPHGKFFVQDTVNSARIIKF